MAQRVTRAMQQTSSDTPSESGKAISLSVPPQSNKKQTLKRTPVQKLDKQPDVRSPSQSPQPPPAPPSSPDPTTSSDPTARFPSPPATTPPSSIEPFPSTLQTSHAELDLAQTRRAALQNLQATQYSHLAGISEPDLNDLSEVRHFEVDSQGSLTFILLDGGEAWRLREVGIDSTEKGQMVVGRFYVVERV